MQDQEQVQNIEQPKFKVVHAQVRGETSMEDLQQVARSLNDVLQKGSSDFIVTNDNVSIHVIHQEGDPPVHSVYVRAALTFQDLVIAAYRAAHAISSRTNFHELPEEEQNRWYNEARAILRHGVTEPSVFSEVILSLKDNLPTPSKDRTIQIWNGATVLDDNAWSDFPFSQLRASTIFREPGGSTVMVTLCDAYVIQELHSSTWAIDAAEAEVAGTKPVDAQDLSKGFVLQWRLKNFQLQAAPDEQLKTEYHAEATDDQGVQDVEFTEKIDQTLHAGGYLENVYPEQQNVDKS